MAAYSIGDKGEIEPARGPLDGRRRGSAGFRAWNPDLKVNSFVSRRGAGNPIPTPHIVIRACTGSPVGNFDWSATMVSRRRALTMTAGAIGALTLAQGAAAAAGSARPGRIPYGACVRPVPLVAERDYRTLIQTNCQQITPEGGLVWGHLRPVRDLFNFDSADDLLAFAEANEMTMRGHTLVWYGSMPDWTKSIHGADEAKREMTTHIEHVCRAIAARSKPGTSSTSRSTTPKGRCPACARASGWEIWARIISTWRFAPRTPSIRRPSSDLRIRFECPVGPLPKRREAFLKLIRDLVGAACRCTASACRATSMAITDRSRRRL